MQTLGIDAGGTLIKIAFTRGNEVEYIKFPSSRLSDVAQWIHDNHKKSNICITGGKSAQLKELLQLDIHTIVEFEASCNGARYLAEKQGIPADSFVLTNVGTGTSIHYVDQKESIRIGGSGVGGGTLMGLSYLLSGAESYDQIISLARTGKRNKIDLTVFDIYEGAVPPIPGDLTASNFGKVRPNLVSEKADILASVMGLVGETITTVSVHAAAQYDSTSVIYIGSTFVENDYLKEIVTYYSNLRGADAYFLHKGDFSGAIGALRAII